MILLKRTMPILLLFLWIPFGCTKITAPVDDLPPATPSTFTLLGGGDGEAHFRWTKNTEPDFDKYRIYRAVGTPQNFLIIAELRQTEYVDRFLDYNTTYFYYIVSMDFAGNESLPSDIIDVQPLNVSSPPPPGNLLVKGVNNPNLSQLEVQVSWSAPNVSDVDNYFVYRGLDESFPVDSTSFIGSTPASTYIDRNIQTGQSYYYKVVARDRGDKLSFPSAVNSDLVLNSPILLSPVNQSVFTSPQMFTWQAVANAKDYQVFVGRGPFSDIVWSSSKTKQTEILYTGPTLSPNSIYYWWVGAYSKEDTQSTSGIIIKADVNAFSQIWTFFVQ